MGMYTGLRFKVTVNINYREYIGRVLKEMEWIPNDTLPIEKWLHFYRNSFIPWGDLCYMPTKWEEEEEQLGHTSYNIQTGEWRVICSLKDYENEIEWFLENILSKIIDSYKYIEYLYEEWDEPEMYVPKIGG